MSLLAQSRLCLSMLTALFVFGTAELSAGCQVRGRGYKRTSRWRRTRVARKPRARRPVARSVCRSYQYRNGRRCVSRCPYGKVGWRWVVGRAGACSSAAQLRALIGIYGRMIDKLYAKSGHRSSRSITIYRRVRATARSALRRLLRRGRRTYVTTPPPSSSPPPPTSSPPPPTSSPPPPTSSPPPPTSSPPPPTSSPPPPTNSPPLPE